MALKPHLVAPQPQKPQKAQDESEIARRRMRHLKPFGVTVRPPCGLPRRSGPVATVTDIERAAALRIAQRVQAVTLLSDGPPTAME